MGLLADGERSRGQPLPPTLHLTPCEQFRFPNYQVCTCINSLVYAQPPSPCRCCSQCRTVPGDEIGTQAPAPLPSTPRPPDSNPSCRDLCSPQRAAEFCTVLLLQTHPHWEIPKHRGFGIPTAQQVIKLALT